MTPFLKAVTRALSYELEEGHIDIEKRNLDSKQKAVIFNEILQNLPTENSASNFCASLNLAADTLKDGFDQLKRLNIK